MNWTPAQIIQKKRDGNELTADEIQDFVHGLRTGEVADYQATALLMAVFFRGLNLKETVALTDAMRRSGDQYDFSKVPGPKVDKHSTGGVGDKVSLVLAPLAAACGLKVPMMAGRGLGHSGGTVDKLEAIPGYNAQLPQKRFEEILKNVGCVIVGQSESIAPADKKLYALRDVTATVDCIPLIVASILSKKLAEGTEGLVMDVKTGNGAFMQSIGAAKRLAACLVKVGKRLKLPVRALLTNMDQPLGYASGNSVEVIESIELLRGTTPNEFSSSDLKELTIQLCAHMLHLGRVVKNLPEGRRLAHARLADGSAWSVFEKMVEAQGGSLDAIRDPSRLPLSSKVVEWKAPKTGTLNGIDTVGIGMLLIEMGGGRKKASDTIDPGVGLLFGKKLGAPIRSGEPIARAYLPKDGDAEALEARFLKCLTIGKTRKPVPKLIQEIAIK